MKKIKIVTLILIAFMCIGCSNNKSSENNFNGNKTVNDESNINKKEEVKEMEEDENKREEKDYRVVYKRYENVDKSKLKYTLVGNEWYIYETSNSFAINSILDKNPSPNIDNKKYDEILLSYTFSAELIPIAMKYDEAINYTKSILPDDIKEERVKFDDELGTFHIIYSSSKGNFVVGLSTGIVSTENGRNKYDKEWINGISYLKEIV